MPGQDLPPEHSGAATGDGRSLAPGRRLGDFELIREISRGGMGVIYEAREISLDRRVALKLLPEDTTRDPVLLDRLLREARTLATLKHPNIVTIHSILEEEGTRLIVMELVEGMPLDQLIPPEGLPLDRLLRLAVPLADALSAVHRRGITHRDLKPANVVVTPDGYPKLVDFGLTKVTEPTRDGAPVVVSDRVTQDGFVRGTLPFLSPEQLEGKPASPASDLFSFGVILFAMATGRLPFFGASPDECMLATLRDVPPPITELNPALPEALARVVTRCLEKTPESRYASAREAREELEAIARATAAPRRTRLGIALRVAAVIVPVVAIAAALYFALRPASRDTIPQAAARGPRIAVLSFENVGPPDLAYLAPALSDEITSRLASVGGLVVVSRTSAAHYDRAGKSVRKIGEDLRADYLLEGTLLTSVGPAGRKRIRVTPTLVRVTDDTDLWTERYDREMEDLLEVQSEIAIEVARRVGVTLGAPERRALDVRPSTQPDAYQAYLRGMGYTQTYLESDLRLAADMFQRAVELDPGFALAWAELSRVHTELYHFWADPTQRRLDLARGAAERALKLAPDLPEGHRALGEYYYRAFKDYDRALRELLLATASRPNDSASLMTIGLIRRRQARWNDALAALRRVAELDPRNSLAALETATTLSRMRRYRDAEREYERSILLAPDQFHAYLLGSNNLVLEDGTTRRARPMLDRAPHRNETELIYFLHRIETYDRNYRAALEVLGRMQSPAFEDRARYLLKPLLECASRLSLGDVDRGRAACEDARRALEERVSTSPDDPRLHSALGMAYGLLGRKSEALAEGERAVALCPIEKDSFDGPDYVIALAAIEAHVGETSAAIEHLRTVLAVPSDMSSGRLRIEPNWDPIREDPRFRALAATPDKVAR